MAKRLVAIVIVIGSIVLWQARLRRAESSREASAIAAMSAIAKAQTEYAASAGNAGYAITLAALATPCRGTRRVFLSPDTAGGLTLRTAYEIALRAKPSARRVSSDCNGAPTYSGYYATATPEPGASPGWRAFAVDETGTIWVDTTGTAPRPPFRQTASTNRLF